MAAFKYGESRFRTFWWGKAKCCVTCPGGGAWWPLDFFTSQKTGQGGLDNRCNACRLDYQIRRRKRLAAGRRQPVSSSGLPVDSAGRSAARAHGR
jgi:hypothetical protein